MNSSEKIQRLVNLGYYRKVCELALRISDNHFERAREWLRENAEDWMRAHGGESDTGATKRLKNVEMIVNFSVGKVPLFQDTR